MKMTVFLAVAPCSLVHVHRRFRSAYRLYENRNVHLCHPRYPDAQVERNKGKYTVECKT